MAFEQLVRAANIGRPLARAAVFAVVALVTVVGIQTAATTPSPLLSLLGAAGTFVWMVVLTWLFTRFVDRRSFRSIGLWSDHFIWHWARGFATGVGMFIVTLAIMAVSGTLEVAAVASGPQLLTPVVFLLFFLIQGPAEEIMGRGYLLPTLTAGANLPVAVVLTSVYFAVLHGMNPNITLLGGINLFLAGAFLALYFVTEGQLWGVFGWHTAWNWTQASLLGLPVSGLELPRPLVDLEAAGFPWLTGGAFGPEGGAAVTVVLLTGVGYLAWRHRAR